MLDFFNALVSNQIFNAVITLIATLIAVFSFILYLKDKKKTGFKVATASFCIISKEAQFIPNLKIYYKEVEIKELYITNIVFWNRKSCIKKTDIANSDPIRILASEQNQIFDAKVIIRSDERNGISTRLENDGKSYLVSFEYLEKHDGAIIQVLHSGNKSIRLKGKVINGIQEHIVDTTSLTCCRPKRNFSKTLYNIIMSLVTLFMIPLIVFMVSRVVTLIPSAGIIRGILFIITAVILLICGFMMLYCFYRSGDYSIPKKLRNYSYIELTEETHRGE